MIPRVPGFHRIPRGAEPRPAEASDEVLPIARRDQRSFCTFRGNMQRSKPSGLPVERRTQRDRQLIFAVRFAKQLQAAENLVLSVDPGFRKPRGEHDL
jgi:hypothetical protein